MPRTCQLTVPDIPVRADTVLIGEVGLSGHLDGAAGAAQIGGAVVTLAAIAELTGSVDGAVTLSDGPAGMAHGGTDDGAPGLRTHYHEHYYAAFLLDPDGNRVEAVCHRTR